MLSVYHNIYDKTMLFCLHLFLLLAEEAKSDTNIRSFCSMLQGNYSSSTHSCFKYVGGSYSWDKAYSKCRREARRRGIRKGRLAVIPSSTVFDIVKKLALSPPYAWGEHYYGWIGLKPKGSSYEHSKEAYRHGSYSPYKHQWAFYEGYKRVAPFSYVPQSVQVDLPSGVCMQFSYTAVGYDDYTCKDVLGGAVCEFLHPIDCRWGHWNQWSDCSVTCGTGSHSRRRVVSVHAQDGGEQCHGSYSHTQTCTGNPCPIDCVWGKWSPWSACSVTCGNGTKTATRDNAVVAQHRGRPCVGEKILSESCYPVNQLGQTVQFCPVDCIWANWGPWSNCSVACGNGSITRTRVEASPAQHGGNLCQAEARIHSSTCYGKFCPIDCIWASWGQWSGCSVTCGEGVRTRKRIKAVSVEYGGKSCPGNYTDSEFCYGLNLAGVTLQLCPIDCIWANWGSWSDCSITCGNGTRTRKRVEATTAQHGGNPCNAEASSDTVFCYGVNAAGITLKFCPIDCFWANWEQWSKCSVTCGNGTRIRKRSEAVTAQYNGQHCPGPNSEIGFCYGVSATGITKQFCPIDCVWETWNQWSGCSVSCGNGTWTRTRYEIPGHHGGNPCYGVRNESQFCYGVDSVGMTLEFCPVDCEWAVWEEWSECSVTCGNGTKIRMRNETVPAQYNGKQCPGPNNETYFCYGISATGVTLQFCPIDCVWETWNEWSACSVTCNNGTRTRYRNEIPAKYGGEACLGSSNDSGHCYGVSTYGMIVQFCQFACMLKCIVDCWAGWLQWSSCTRHCGKGQRTRTRGLLFERSCYGDDFETEYCNINQCQECQWNDWGQWGICSVTCGNGTQVRYKTKWSEGLNDSADCRGPKMEQRPCAALCIEPVIEPTVEKVFTKSGITPDIQSDGNSLSATVYDSLPYVVSQLSMTAKLKLGHTKADTVPFCFYDGKPCLDSDWSTFYDGTFGNCFTFNYMSPPKYNSYRAGAAPGLLLLLQSSQEDYVCSSQTAGFKFYIHSSTEHPFPDTAGISVPPGVIAAVGIRLGCFRSCFQKTLIDNCKCGDPRIPLPPTNDSKICGLRKRECLEFYRECEAHDVENTCEHCKYPCVENIFSSVVTTSELKRNDLTRYACKLSNPNNQTTYRDCLKTFRRNYATVQVYYETLTTIGYSESSAYSTVELCSNFGGIMGIIMGASVITLTEFLYAVLDLIVYNISDGRISLIHCH